LSSFKSVLFSCLFCRYCLLLGFSSLLYGWIIKKGLIPYKLDNFL
jgi:hypothetical protein